MKNNKTLFGTLTIALGLLLSAQAQNQFTNGLVAYYPFNGNANDASGNGHNGTNINATLAPDRFGVPNGCYSFNGTNSHVDIGSSIVLGNPHDAMTLSAWFLLRSTFNPQFDADFVVVSDYSGPDGSSGDYTFFGEINFQHYSGVTNLLFFDRSYPAFGGATVISPAVVNDNLWHSSTAVVDGQGTISLYVDGVLSSQGTYDASLSYTHGQFWRIGADQFSNQLWNVLNGFIDDVRFYNRALSASEVQHLYVYESAPSQSFLTNGLVAYYPFNGNANDAIGTNNGTLVGTDWKFATDRFGNPQSALFLNTTSPPSVSLNGAYVSAPSSAALDFSKDFTLSVWVNNASGWTNQQETLISNGNDGDGFIDFSITPRGSVYGGNDGLNCGWGGVNGVGVAVAPVQNTWWQIVVVRSGIDTTLFRNGSALTNNATMTAPLNSATIWLGRWQPVPPGNPNATLHLFGGIDDVRMYHRAPSTNEVHQLYAYEAAPRVSLKLEGSINAVQPSFSRLMPGVNYQLQISSDLNTWYDEEPIITATSMNMVYPLYYDVGFWNQLFFRLHAVP